MQSAVARRPSWQSVAFLFFLGWAFIYANRNVMSAVLKHIGMEWGLSRTELGLINSAFFLAYTAGQIPTGFLADRFSRRALLLPGYYLQSVACAFAALVRTPSLFLATRVASGIGQSTYYASQYALVAQYLPPEKRAFGMACINSGMAGGVIVGLLAGSFMVYGLNLPWRTPFLVLGLLGVITAAAIQRTVVEDTKPAAKELPGSSQSSGGQYLTRDFWIIWFASLGTQYGFYLILSWLPYYLQEVRGFTGLFAGAVSSLMPLVAGPSSMALGYISDRIGKRKQIALVVIPVSALALGVVGLSMSPYALYMGLLLYGLSGKMSLDPILVSAITERIDASRRASALGILNFAATISMVSAPLLTGYLADATGSFVYSFYVAILLSVCAAAGLAFLSE